MIQPEPNMIGQFGNGWKGVWKWCEDNQGKLKAYMPVSYTHLETQAGADTAGLSGYDGNSCTESGAAGEQKKGSNTGRAAKIRFGVRNAH